VTDLAATGMLHLVEVAMVAIVMDMAVNQKASVTCRLGCVSARIIQRGTHATSARRDITEILGGYLVGRGSYMKNQDISLLFIQYFVLLL
jgi:hypothetical protein